jgi:hypothetical protein
MSRRRWYAPLDPDCPVVVEYARRLFEYDPLTEAMGVSTDEIMKVFARRHRVKCSQCWEFSMTTEVH